MTRYTHSIFALFTIFSISFAAGPARAADWYVDSVSGSNANNGTTPAMAWKTISHALTSLSSGAGPDTIHIAAGTYGVATGEIFPLIVRDNEQLVGAGPDVTIVSAATTQIQNPIAFKISAQPAFNPNGVTPSTVLSGMTITNATVCVALYTGDQACDPVLRDLVLRDSWFGIRVFVSSAPGAGPASASPRMSRVRFQSNGGGFSVYAASDVQGPPAGVFRVHDSTFAANGTGVELAVRGRFVQMEVERSIIDGSTAVGIDTGGIAPGSAPSTNSLLVRDSVITRNMIGGIRLRDSQGGTSIGLIEGCTIAGNVGYGVRETGGSFEIRNSIVWGNGSSLEVDPSYAIVRYCDYAGLPLPLGQNNLHVDPKFRDATAGDYRLRSDSPCIDSADPVGSTPMDLTGTSRRMDGNLDTVRAPDMGAHELQTLNLAGTPAIGQQIGFEFLGAAGASSTLFVAHAAPIAPQQTPFGLLYLPVAQTAQSATVIAQPGPPYVLRRRLPNNPALIGTTYSFQALTDSALAPAGRAYTNPITFTVLP